VKRIGAVACCLAIGLAVAGCGRYGPPVRTPRPAAAPAPPPEPPLADPLDQEDESIEDPQD
jgi:hypothetical protein